MEFSYLPVPMRDKSGAIVGQRYFPLIPIRIICHHKVGRPINCLLDSGSERNLFPANYAEQFFGIKVIKGKHRDIRGIGNINIDAYTWDVKFYIKSTSFATQVDFSYEQQVPLLGRNGFFNHFQEIIFKEKQKVVFLNK